MEPGCTDREFGCLAAAYSGCPVWSPHALGKYGPLAYLVSAAGIALIAACLSEVASQFRETGGPYLYARTALGRFWGIQIAWDDVARAG